MSMNEAQVELEPVSIYGMVRTKSRPAPHCQVMSTCHAAHTTTLYVANIMPNNNPHRRGGLAPLPFLSRYVYQNRYHFSSPTDSHIKQGGWLGENASGGYGVRHRYGV